MVENWLGITCQAIRSSFLSSIRQLISVRQLILRPKDYAKHRHTDARR